MKNFRLDKLVKFFLGEISCWGALIFCLTVCFLVALPAFADSTVIEGKVTTQEDKKEPQDYKIIQSGVSKDLHRNVDVQVLKVNFFYHPDADITYEVLKAEGQKQYPHLLGYKEIDGIYRKALSESQFEEELTVWRYQSGPRPYYINAGAEIRNNGTGAMTDVKLRFDIEVKTGVLKANNSTLTTDYRDLQKNARWEKWLTKTVSIDVLPPGEYTMIHTEDFSLCPLFEKLKDKWPESMRVKVYAYAAMDSIKTNNYAIKSIQLIPDHFVIDTIH